VELLPHSAAPVARAVRIDTPIRVDGRLDEPAWDLAPEVTDFTQLDPDEGASGTERTVVRILYDDEAIYFGVRLHDRHPITTRLGRRDMPTERSDWFAVVLDSYHDHRTAFSFSVNPSGVRRDQSRAGESDDASWDPVWDVATSIDEQGWTAEFRIPFSQLRFGGQDEQLWGLQLERVISRNEELAVWSFTPKREPAGIARFGHLEGLRSLATGRRLEVLPYTVTRAEYVDPGENPFRTGSSYAVDAGVDLKYRISSNFTADVSINPDFGQVEVDPAIVNLGVYETRFDEKRPFFIEGSEIYNFSVGSGQSFYSRRIGRAPQMATPTALASAPSAVRILGAAKVSGKTPDGWSVGLLEAVTGEERARYRTSLGEDRSMVVEPMTNYFLSRVRREAREGATSAGGIFTAVHRNLPNDAVRAALGSSAYSGGVDVRHEWDNRRWSVSGNFGVSHIVGDPRAITAIQRRSNHMFQRPDATHLRVDSTATSLSGFAGIVALSGMVGEHWRGEVSGALTTPGYDVNDIGFNHRTDRRDATAVLTYVQNRPGGFWRNWSVTGRGRFEHNNRNQLLSNWTRLQANFRHLDYWTLNVAANRTMRASDDRFTRGGPMAVRPESYDWSMRWASDPRGAVAVEVGGGTSWDEYGGWGQEAALGVRVSPSPRLFMSVGPRIVRGHVVAQYVTAVADPDAVETFGRRYVFAELDQTEVGLETRLNLTFTPDLTFEMYAQPLVSSGDYGGPKFLTAPSSFDFAFYDGTVPDRSFNLRSLRGTALLRWQWRPGSTLYLAWEQSREDVVAVGDFDLVRDHRALLSARPDNILVLKVNYWLNP